MPVLLSPKRTLHVLTIRMVQTRRSSALNGVDAHNNKLDRPEPPSKKVKVSSLNSVTRHTPELWFIPVTHWLRIQVYYQSRAYVRRVLQITTCINVKCQNFGIALTVLGKLEHMLSTAEESGKCCCYDRVSHIDMSESSSLLTRFFRANSFAFSLSKWTSVSLTPESVNVLCIRV